MAMFRYYQENIHQRDTWKACEEGQIPEAAKHVTVLARSIEAGPGIDEDQVLWTGDFPMDLDCGSLEEAIAEARKLVSFIGESFDAKFLRVYASGKKGFHIFVPWAAMWPSRRGVKNLPRVYKALAEILTERAQLRPGTLDMLVYSGSKGHTLRVENIQRPEGTYKVPITAQELANMTPGLYQHLVSAPRYFGFEAPQVQYTLWTSLLKEAKARAAKPAPEPFDAAVVPEAFGGEIPECIRKLTEFEDVKTDSGIFNKAGVVLASFIHQSGTDESTKKELIRQVANAAFQARKHSAKTLEDRVTDLVGKCDSAKSGNYDFRCGAARNLFHDITGMCEGCPVAKHVSAEISTNFRIFEEGGCYQKQMADGVLKPLTNFLFKNFEVFVPDPTDPSMEGDLAGYRMDIHFSPTQMPGKAPFRIFVEPRRWVSTLEMKKLITTVRGASWLGTDNELTDLRAYIDAKVEADNNNADGVKIVQIAEAAGVHRFKDRLGTERKVWVDPDGSLAEGGVRNVMKLVRKVDSVFPASAMFDTPPQSPAIHKALRLLLHSNQPWIVATLTGWMAACHLKVHLQPALKDFPLLQLAGNAGVGKTATARLYSALALADHRGGNDPFTMEGATPYFALSLVSSTTTVPRVLDEVNPSKFVRMSSWNAVKGALKGAYSNQKQGKGTRKGGAVHGSSYGELAFRLSAPCLYMSTSPITDPELVRRTIIVELTEAGRKPFEQTFTELSTGAASMEYHTALLQVGRVLMTAALDMTDEKALALYSAFTPPSHLDGGKLTCWGYIPMGLEFMARTLASKIYRGRYPEDILERLWELQKVYVDLTSSAEAAEVSRKIKTELQLTFEILAALAVDGTLMQGVHYTRFGNQLYLAPTPAYMTYSRYAHSARIAQEYQKPQDFLEAVRKLPIYQGEKVEENGKRWTVLNLQPWLEEGIDVHGFKNSD